MFNKNITQKEQQLGFELKKILNPQRNYFLSKKKINAVLFYISALVQIIIKIDSSTSGIVYTHQRFGIYAWTRW